MAPPPSTFPKYWVTLPATFLQPPPFWEGRHESAIMEDVCHPVWPVTLTALTCCPPCPLGTARARPQAAKQSPRKGPAGAAWAGVPAPPSPPICKSNLSGIPALRTRRQDFSGKIFTEGFLPHNLSILISSPLWLNVSVTLRSTTANLNTFYLLLAFRMSALGMMEAAAFPRSVLEFVFPICIMPVICHGDWGPRAGVRPPAEAKVAFWFCSSAKYNNNTQLITDRATFPT